MESMIFAMSISSGQRIEQVWQEAQIQIVEDRSTGSRSLIWIRRRTWFG
jgi:hypothetical protein